MSLHDNLLAIALAKLEETFDFYFLLLVLLSHVPSREFSVATRDGSLTLSLISVAVVCVPALLRFHDP